MTMAFQQSLKPRNLAIQSLLAMCYDLEAITIDTLMI